jgi:3-oxoacyl-[acyl-carrier-protein] synthase-1/3-oxoacyl-[acyl-carrier-protein] synthase II
MRQKIPAAITGVGCICGAGGTLVDCIETLFEGRRNPLPPLRFTSTHGVQYPVFEVPEAAIRLELKNTDFISLTGKLAITAAYEAFIDAGL